MIYYDTDSIRLRIERFFHDSASYASLVDGNGGESSWLWLARVSVGRRQEILLHPAGETFPLSVGTQGLMAAVSAYLESLPSATPIANQDCGVIPQISTCPVKSSAVT
jgi:hypothetical protein